MGRSVDGTVMCAVYPQQGKAPWMTRVSSLRFLELDNSFLNIRSQDGFSGKVDRIALCIPASLSCLLLFAGHAATCGLAGGREVSLRNNMVWCLVGENPTEGIGRGIKGGTAYEIQHVHNVYQGVQGCAIASAHIVISFLYPGCIIWRSSGGPVRSR